MVLNGRKLLIVFIVVLAVALSLVALNRIIIGPQSSEVPSSADIQVSQNRSPSANSYFAEHRMIRERNRSRQIELLEKIVNNDRMDSQNKIRAARDLIALTEISERERQAEETVKAIGYPDCVVLIRENAALAVIAAESLNKEKEQLLANQLTEILNLNSDKITIMAHPNGKITR